MSPRIRSLAFWGIVLVLIVALVSVYQILATPAQPTKLSLQQVSPDHIHSARELTLEVRGEGLDEQTHFCLVRRDQLKTEVSDAYHTYSSLNALVQKGELLFLANGSRGLMILMPGEDSGFERVGVLDLPGVSWDIRLVGDLAYVASKGVGLLIVDVSDPASPKLLKSVEGLSNAVALDIDGPLAAVSDPSQGIFLLDLTDPADPVVRPDFVGARGVLDLHWNGDLLYGAGAREGLVVIDPQGRELRRRPDLEVEGHFLTIDFFNEYLYLAGRDGLDVFRADNSERLMHLDFPHAVTSLSRWGDQLLAGLGSQGLQLVDIKKPEAPLLLERIQGVGNVRKIYPRGSQLLLAAGNKGLLVLDASDLSQLSQTGNQLLEGVMDFRVIGRRAIAQMESGRLLVLDLRDMDFIKELVSFELDAPILGSLYKDGIFYFIDTFGTLSGLDLRSTGSVQRLFSVQLDLYGVTLEPRRTVSMAMDGDRLYVSSKGSRVFVLQLLGKGAQVLGQFEAPSPVRSMIARNQHLYLSCGRQGVLAYDLSDAESPRLLDQVRSPWHQGGYAQASSMAVMDDVLFVGNGLNGISALSLKTPGKLSFLGGLELPGRIEQLLSTKEMLFVASRGGGVFGIDVSTPERMNVICAQGHGLDVAQLGLNEEELFLLLSDGRLFATSRDVDMKITGHTEQGVTLLPTRALAPGEYRLQAFRGAQRSTLDGIVVQPVTGL